MTQEPALELPGEEESLQVAREFDLAEFGLPIGIQAVPGTAQAYTVKGSRRFELAELVANPKTTDRSGPGPGWVRAESLFWLGVGGTSGMGDDSSFTPLAAAAAGPHGTPVEIIANWPWHGEQLYVWPQLPESTAVVTYSYHGATTAWERPLNGHVAFLVPRPASFNGYYAVWHSAPLPNLCSYNAQGQLLRQVKAPRIDADNLAGSAHAFQRSALR